MKITTIMPSYLGDYAGAATNRENKFRRAVISWWASSYPDKELIVISDGCQKTIDLFLDIFKIDDNPHNPVTADSGIFSIQAWKNGSVARVVKETGGSRILKIEELGIQLIYVPKQPTFSGKVRNAGLDAASGRVITYLDTDDKLLPGHLEAVAEAFKPNTLYEQHRWVPDWIYFDDYLALFDINVHRERNVSLQSGGVGTSNIAHRHGLSVRWSDSYGHDWLFVKDLMERYPNYRMAKGMKYLTCHIPNSIDV